MAIHTTPTDAEMAGSARRPKFGDPMKPDTKPCGPRTATILIVDDDTDTLGALKMIMELEGHTAITACNGKQGLEKYLEGSFDLVISDLHMPEMNGLEMLGHIRKANPGAKVIIASAEADEEEKGRLHEAGAFAVLTKPVEISTLEEIMARALGS